MYFSITALLISSVLAAPIPACASKEDVASIITAISNGQANIIAGKNHAYNPNLALGGAGANIVAASGGAGANLLGAAGGAIANAKATH